MAALPLMCFSLQACGDNRTAVAIKPPAERLKCDSAAARPAIPAEHSVRWEGITTLAQAKAEHEAYVRSIRSREGIVVGYLVAVEGKLFECFNNMAWQRDFWGKVP